MRVWKESVTMVGWYRWANVLSSEQPRAFKRLAKIETNWNSVQKQLYKEGGGYGIKAPGR